MYRFAPALLAACAAPAPVPAVSLTPGHAGQLAITPASLELPADVGDAATHDFTVENLGSTTTATLGLSALTGAELRIASDDCFGRSLAPGETCTVSVRFAPTVSGVQRATLAVGDATAAIAGLGRMPMIAGLWSTQGFNRATHATRMRWLAWVHDAIRARPARGMCRGSELPGDAPVSPPSALTIAERPPR